MCQTVQTTSPSQPTTPAAIIGTDYSWDVSSNSQVQSPARALKRQRQRERRRLGWPQSKPESAANAASTSSSAKREVDPTISFEARAAEVAKEAKLVVKGTFLDVECTDLLASVDDATKRRFFELPPACFESTSEIDEWRRAYRMFRLGYHLGARGEFIQAAENVDIVRSELKLDKFPEEESPIASTCCSDAEACDTLSSCSSVSPDAARTRWGDEEDSENETRPNELLTAPALTGRAAKRQKQRERRRLFKVA